ncbi:MAG: hypothetical protein ACFFDB_01335 [Promethearchaeota archaeon]
MINSEQNSREFKESSKVMQIQGACVLRMTKSGEFEILFQNGLDYSLIYSIINSVRSKIINNQEGTVRDFVGDLNAYLLYSTTHNFDTIIALFVNSEKGISDYSKLDEVTKTIFERIGINTTNLKIKKIIINSVKSPRERGLIGFLALDKTGLLYFSRVRKNMEKISKNIFQIAGFISAILIYSKDLISGDDPELQLEDINLGSHHFYVNVKNNVIFAYFVEKNETSENFNKYIHIVLDKFIERYYNPYITNFKGDLTPFYNFDTVIDQYFEI